MWSAILAVLGKILSSVTEGFAKAAFTTPKDTVEIKEADHAFDENPTVADSDALVDDILERHRVSFPDDENGDCLGGNGKESD